MYAGFALYISTHARDFLGLAPRGGALKESPNRRLSLVTLAVRKRERESERGGGGGGRIAKSNLSSLYSVTLCLQHCLTECFVASFVQCNIVPSTLSYRVLCC